jgi:alpha-mannosidase
VSLLRAPTWPDPGADNGWQRQRLALLPAPGGWRRAAVPEQARRLREPLWLHPASEPTTPCEPSSVAAPATTPTPGASAGSAWPGFPALEQDLRLVGLRPAGPMAGAEVKHQPAEAPGGLILTVLNESPCRRRLALPAPWRVLDRLDGLDQPLPDTDGADPLVIRPWQLTCWRIDRTT